MTLLVTIVLFLLLMAGISYYGYRRWVRPSRIYEQLGAPVINAASQTLDEQAPAEPGSVVRVLEHMGAMVPVSPTDAVETRNQLIMAGYRADNAMTIFYGIKIVAAVMLPILAFLFLWDRLGSNPALRMLVILFSGAAGFVLPNSMLRRRVRARQEVLRLSLPDALDLMVISVEAGLGLDQAIQHVGKELAISHPQVSEELSLVGLEMRAGKRRSEALRNLAERTGEPELRKLVAILIQNDRFGTSMAESLRAHSDFMRTRRRQEAEERAAKVGVKLVFPIFFFILPSMLVVAAGPGLLQIFKNLFPMMRQVR